MQYIAYGLMGVAMVAALGIVIAGLIVMSKGGAVNEKWGNRLMRYRVMAQMVAIAMFLLGMWLSNQA